MDITGSPAPAGQDQAPDRTWRALLRRAAAPGSAAPVSIGIGLSGLIPHRGIRAVVSLAGLGVSLWYVVSTIPVGPSGAPLAALISLVVAGLSWLVWLAGDVAGVRRPALLAASVLLAAAGGVLASAGSAGLIFVGVGSGGAAIAFDLPVAVPLAAAAPAAYAVAADVRNALPGRLLSVAVVALVALVTATGRRQMVQRARQQALITTARQRAEVIRREAELVGERNRLGRELHDVLAHTLGALSIQLTALDTLVRTGASRGDLRTEIQRSHELVGEGLDEARQAVRALRDDTAPLDRQLERLGAQHQATVEVSGPPRPVRAEAALALYRVAQEALTNAAKHAPGAPATITVSFGTGEVTVSVRNDGAGPAAHSRVSRTGGGYGLSGMRERVRLAGGQCEAGPAGDGWQVTARVPG
jgi:signal transduction histidine kinase